MNTRDREATFQIDAYLKSGGSVCEERTGDDLYTEAGFLLLHTKQFKANASFATVMSILANQEHVDHIITRRIYRHHTNSRSSFWAYAKPAIWRNK